MSGTSSTSSRPSTEEILEVLRRCVPRPGPERVLAEDVRRALQEAGIPFAGEAGLETGRVDIRVSSTAVELKVRGSPASVIRQLARYGDDPTVEAVVLVTTSRKIASQMPTSVRGKPLRVVHLLRL